MGNVLFDKHMSVRRDAALHDLWSPVASTAEARVVPARAAAYGRVTEGIDLIAAFPQVVLGGSFKHHIIIPDCLKQVMHPEERERESIVRQTATPGVRVQRCCVRFCQTWLRFHHEFRWLVDPEPMAHRSRSSGIARVLARWGRCWCDQACGESQRILCVRGASWTKRAGEGGGDILSRTLPRRVVEDSRVGN